MDKKKYMTTGLAGVFAVASGLAIGNLYWAQPLLAQIAVSLSIPTQQAGLLITATQIGYALGIFLLVPLGDYLNRRKLLMVMMTLTLGALIFCAVSPGFVILTLALASLGLVTISGQILLPMAGDLAAPNDRGRIVGIVTSGITTGILFARFISGILANALGWRAVYLIAAGLNLAALLIIMFKVPNIERKTEQFSYIRLIGSVFTTFKRYRVMPLILLHSGLIFGVVFNMFWTSLTFQLSGAHFGFNTFQIGLVSLSGLAGALGGMGIGKVQDRGFGVPMLGISVVLSAIGMIIAGIGGNSLIALVIAAIIFSLGAQGVSILCQSRLFALSDHERSRLNTAFVVNNFIFAAIGGWSLVTTVAALVSALALAVWLLARKSFLRQDREAELISSEAAVENKN